VTDIWQTIRAPKAIRPGGDHHRVLINCLKIRRPNTGLHQFCLQLGQALIRAADPNRETLYFYVPKEWRRPFGADQNYFSHHAFHKNWLPGTGKFKVWHSTYQNSRHLPPKGRTRMVLTIHDLNFLIEERPLARKRRHYLGEIQRSIDRSDHVVCISNYTRDCVQEHLRMGDKPIEVIYNGCATDDFPEFDQPSYRPEVPFIFSLGALLPKKNFHVLPALLRGHGYQLLIAGAGDSEYAELIRGEARRHGVENRVRFLGPIAEPEKFWYYQHCLAFAFPSLAEGFGLPVVEAMQFGKPVFLSTHASLPEIGGAAAHFFTSFDPDHMQSVFQERLASHDEARAIAVRQHAAKFSWQRAAEGYLRIYRQWD